MECRLIRATSTDYRTFRRAYERIEYSFFKKGEEKPSFAKEIMKETYDIAPIYGKGEYLDLLESPGFEIYFFEIDKEVMGIVELVFSETECNIRNFSVFEHGKGFGTIMFQETINIIRSHKSQKITLWCPYIGSQFFWKKMGFRQKVKFQPIPAIFKSIPLPKENLQEIQKSFNASFEMQL